MNFNVTLPFIKLNFLNASLEQKYFFDELFFKTNLKTKIVFSVTVKTVASIKTKDFYFVEKNCIANKTDFILLDTKKNKCKINFHDFSSEKIKIEIEKDFDLYYLFTFVIEPLMIIWGAHHQILFLHASGIAKNKKVTLYPAWRNTGKTNTILDMCKKGYDFCGDDFCALYKKNVYLYPKALNLFSYNLRAFPSVYAYLKPETVLRLKFTTQLKKLLFTISQKMSGPLSKVFFRISELAEVTTNIKLSPEKLDISVCETGSLLKTILLVKSKTNTQETIKNKSRIAQDQILSIILYELKDFFELYLKYQFLFSKKQNCIESFELNYKKALKNNITEIETMLLPKGTQ